ncbi:membrane transporter protein [Novymonas esmeraldas]|uniref:Membrane transporter protein n=1 Tax=Novymonas esmeraldas TaxID=1808958 RepID=A0AAW0F677_9TRYP
MAGPETPTASHRGEDAAAVPGHSGGSGHINENTPSARLVLEVLKRSIPLGLAAVAQMSISVVLVAMVGKMVGDTELGATSLACGLLNATAFSFAAGFSGALETVLSHSYGRDPTSKLYGVYGQRMSLMLLIIAAIVGPILAFSDSVLLAIGQNAQVAHFTGQFCRASLFGVYSVMVLEMMRRYFACQHLNSQLSINLIVGAVSFPFVLWACIKVFGFIGSAVAWVILMNCMPGSLLVYLVATGKYKKTWGGWEPTALTNWGPLLRLAFPSMAMMMSEWMSLEVNLIIAGYAPTDELAAFSIVYQCSGILWSMASGIFIEAAVLVGSALGQGKPRFARRCALLCIGLAMACAVVNLTLVALFQYHIPALFTDNAIVHALFRRMLRYFAVYHFFDCVQSSMMGVLRGCGLQSLGALTIALVYSVVGVPLGAVVFFTTSMGVEALWLGPSIGVSVVGFPLYCYLFLYHIKWDELQPRTDEIPSLNTSMDERSMRAYTTTPPPSVPSSDSELQRMDSEYESHRDGGSARRHRSGTPGIGPRPDQGGRHMSNPASPTSGVHDNASFTSLNTFYIPQRSILSAPPFFASSPNPSEAHPPAILAGSVPEAGASASLPQLKLTPAQHDSAVLSPLQRGPLGSSADAGSGGHSGSAPPPPPPLSDSGVTSPALRNTRPRSASSSSSSTASRTSAPHRGPRTNRPNSSSSSGRSRDGTYRT